MAALEKLHIPVIRWPGGCFADQYDWRDGIGPREKRPVRINYTWGGVTYDNSFGTNEFMNYTEKLGADAYIAGNMGSMPPRDMQQWIEYMTADGKSTLAQERSEEHTSELQSLMRNSYAVFCLKTKQNKKTGEALITMKD